jgi:hypothetical protein
MEGLTRLVAESMARHGMEDALDHRRLQWSPWFRCESSFSLLLVPGKPGLFALAEELLAPGELAASGGKRMLAVFQVSETADLGVGLSRIFAPGNPLHSRMKSGRVFARYTVIEDDAPRHAASAAFERWLAASAESATGIVGDFNVPGSLPPQAVDAVQDSNESPVHSEQVGAPSVFPAGF